MARGPFDWLRHFFLGDPARRFAWASVLLLVSLAIAPTKDFFKEWRRYQRQYLHFIRGRPDFAALERRFRGGIHQIWIPELDVVDRCTTCHLGIAEPSLADSSVPQPFRAHPPIPHHLHDWGCVVCHRGQGAATSVADAHGTTTAWEQPIVPVRYVQASCGTCHRSDLRETPQLNRGRQLLVDLNCTGCHKIEGLRAPVMLGPDLTNIGTKVSRQWLYKWLKEPRTLTDADGNVKVNGVDFGEEPRMPKYPLSEQELRALSAYLSSLQSERVEAHQFDARVVAAWAKRPDLVDQGEARFREMFCSTCHPLAVTRAGETKLVGGDIGPELTKVGSKVKPDWLVAWLRNPEGYLPHSRMPRYEWSDQDLFLVTQYIETKLTDPDLLGGVPSLGAPSEAEVMMGAHLFLEKGCAGCHVVQGVKPQEDFGPDLSSVGAKGATQLDFGASKIPRDLISYLHAKITDPLSVNTSARMPQYHLTSADLDAVTTALMAMTGASATTALEKLTVLSQPAEFRPAGEFGSLNARYQCDACHKFSGYGGTLAPDLSYEGSRANRDWLISFLRNPQTLRPTLILRMPEFNMSDRDATVIADYIELVLQAPEVAVAAVDRGKFTPEMAAAGKRLFDERYQCQSCHTIGASGGYVGPSLTNVGNWMTAAWIEAWLRNPQKLVPGTSEPTRAFSEEEIGDLTAYLLSLKQSNPAAKETRASGASGRR